MAAKKLTAQDEANMKILQASNEMLLKTREEAKLRGKTESVKLIENARQDIIQQMNNIDETTAQEVIKKQNTSDNDFLMELLSNDNNTIMDTLNQNEASDDSASYAYYDGTKDESANETITDEENDEGYEFNAIDSDIQYDIIALPSNGQCYKNKISRLPVGYLTAYDENLITSPNLYKDGMVIDFLLKHKILDKSIDVDSLCNGDADAITLFLRATSYGPEYPVIVVDPITGENINTTIDLSTLKSKEFTLEGDEDGYFDYKLPVSHDDIKFRFLTRKDNKILNKLSKLEDNGIKALNVKSSVELIVDAIKSDKSLNGKEKSVMTANMDALSSWIQKMESKKTPPFNKMITNRLELSIMAVNGNYDRKFIAKYIKNMGAKDSLELRKYILENEPGINFEVNVERPESLGGGSFKTFLDWDDAIFLNIA